MNVRNVFLMSMIFCAAPVVCTAPKVTIHEQAQIFFLTHTKLIQILPLKPKDLMKQYVSLKKEAYQSSMNQGCIDIRYEAHNWKHTIDRLVEKSNLNVDEKNTLNYTCVMLESYLDHIGILSFEGTSHNDATMAKEDDVIIMQKRIAHLSSLLESCNVVPKVSDSTQDCIVQAQEIILNGYANFIKALRPELRRYIKNKFFIKQRVRELKLKEMKISGSIEDLNQKVAAIKMELKSCNKGFDNFNLDTISLNEQWALHVIAVFWVFHIRTITGDIKSTSKKEVTDKDIADTKKTIEHLSSVLKHL